MQTRHQVMLLAAGLLVGAQIGVASIGLPIPDTDQQMEPVPPEAQVLETDSANASAEVPSEPTAAAGESAPTPPIASEPILRAVAPQPEAAHTSPFPRSTDDVPMLPALAAYLDRTAHLRLTGASGNVFPPSSDDQSLLPAQLAYLERREATRIAAQTQQLARSEGSSPSAISLAANQPAVTAPAGPTSSAQDIDALNSRPPTSAGTPF